MDEHSKHLTRGCRGILRDLLRRRESQMMKFWNDLDRWRDDRVRGAAVRVARIGADGT